LKEFPYKTINVKQNNYTINKNIYLVELKKSIGFKIKSCKYGIGKHAIDARICKIEQQLFADQCLHNFYL
jgi:hypothetical protein